MLKLSWDQDQNGILCARVPGNPLQVLQVFWKRSGYIARLQDSSGTIQVSFPHYDVIAAQRAAESMSYDLGWITEDPSRF